MQSASQTFSQSVWFPKQKTTPVYNGTHIYTRPLPCCCYYRSSLLVVISGHGWDKMLDWGSYCMDPQAEIPFGGREWYAGVCLIAKSKDKWRQNGKPLKIKGELVGAEVNHIIMAA